jgi:CheY-like chemotaxis protein
MILSATSPFQLPSVAAKTAVRRGRRKRALAEEAGEEAADLQSPGMRIQAFLVEDLAVVRDSLVEAMEEMAPLKFVGYAATEDGALQWLNTHQGQWDLVIVDLNLAQGSGLGVLRECMPRNPLQKVVVLSNDLHASVGTQCRKLGADEVFDKSADVERLALYCRAQALQLRGLRGKTRSLF